MTDQLFTTRETIAMIINNDPQAMELGMPENAVFQADTIDSPTMRPFCVIRWMPERQGIGPVTQRPFDVWMYGAEGDYTILDRILYRLANKLMEQIAIPTESGMISQIQGRPTSANPTLGKGADLYDDGYKCVVIPWSFVAIARGL